MSDAGTTGGEAAVTDVVIYGRTYRLRGDGDRSYLEELASLVDEKMREVADGTATADTLKVAILASLNIADEYLKASASSAPRETREAERRLARLVTRLDEALAG